MKYKYIYFLFLIVPALLCCTIESHVVVGKATPVSSTIIGTQIQVDGIEAYGPKDLSQDIMKTDHAYVYKCSSLLPQWKFVQRIVPVDTPL